MPAHAADSSSLKVAGGRLYSHTWRGTIQLTMSFAKWNYQVAAKYRGSSKVQYIKTQWVCSASVRNSATVSAGISSKGINGSYSSSWRTVKHGSYWLNTKGQKEASYRSNCVVSPFRDYRSGTIAVKNTAIVKLKGDAAPRSISSVE
ncbi:MAG: hypothetical protein J6M18_00385 [Actinomycetaceae bacterium]|nr:hypothetical protein [Actinomycetaceae bacterium]